MSNVSVDTNQLSLIVPFFGAAVFLSYTFSYYLVRRVHKRIEHLIDRIETLEARPIPQENRATPVPLTFPYCVPLPPHTNYKPGVTAPFMPAAGAPAAAAIV